MNEVRAENIFANKGVASLAAAAAAGDVEGVNGLAKVFDVNGRGDRMATPLLWAFLHQSRQGMLALLRAGADPTLTDDTGKTVMHYAAACNQPALLDVMLFEGVPVDVRNTVTGETPLFNAIAGDRMSQFSALLAAGADVDAADNAGNRPLHQAAKMNDPIKCMKLLEHGANPVALDRMGVTFMCYLNQTDNELRLPSQREAKAVIDAWMASHASIL